MIYTYDEAKEYILDIPKFSSKNNTDITKAFLNELGDISVTVPVVHVAGTNGKGSVCAFVNSVLQNAGYTCAMFTSPHLVSIRERFVTNGKLISHDDFKNCFNELLVKLDSFKKKSVNEEYHPSFFEFLFFMGILYWQKNKPDVLILETGLGGRLDATNSISSPKVCVITEIGFDHMEYLGDTIEKIAFEKAGIIQPSVPVVYVNKDTSGPVIADVAKKMGSKMCPIDKDSYNILKFDGTGIDFCVACRYYSNVIFTVDTCAPYQVENAAIAVNTLEMLTDMCPEIEITKSQLSDGLSNMRWPGRMEKVLPNFIIDGGHNEDGIKAFIDAVKNVQCKGRKLLFSAVSDKQIEQVTKLIIESNLFDYFYVAKLDSYRAASEERLKTCFESVAEKTTFYESVSSAMGAILHDMDDGMMCFAAGSLYLVGEIKRYIDDQL